VPLGHVVHIERNDGHGVKVWLDGVRIKSLSGWSLIENVQPPSVLTFTINTDEIVWGAPPPSGAAEPAPFVDDGLEHHVVLGPSGRRTPSGKYACETCGEAWTCSTATRRNAAAEVDSPSDTPLS
jgi:hypothetical protein